MRTPEPILRAVPGLTREYLHRHRVCPTRSAAAGTLTLAASSGHATHAIEELRSAYGDQLKVTSVSDSELDQLIERLVLEDARFGEFTGHELESAELGLEDLRELANQPPVARYVNLLVREAHDAGASDIHLEATRQGTVARFRVDGVLQSAPTPPRALERAVISRLKAMSELDVTGRRRPQDGRIRVRLDERELDLRIATVPTVHGESVVLRLLDRGGRPVALSELGMMPEAFALVHDAVLRPHGLVLVTGPTGSGKTTTLYAALQCRSTDEEKIVTVEEPVEYQLDGVTQVPVQRSTGVSFAAALRALLRQDPDVVMIGELRDAETAEIAIQAALTGHLVLATLHTNDALGAIPRLTDLGVPEYLLAATLELVIAQRLVRRICSNCARPEVSAQDGSALPEVRVGGCTECRGTGYRGRTGIFEVFRMSDLARRAIAGRSDARALRASFAPGDFTLMHAHAKEIVYQGITTAAEVLRATRA